MRMCKKTFLFLVLISIIFSFNTFASNYTSEDTYYLKIHFGDTNNGKSVSSVMAHVGVETTYPGYMNNPSEWQAIQDVQLKVTNGHFFGKEYLNSSCSYGITCKPVVQYWLTYEDGTKEILNPIEIKIIDSVEITDKLPNETSEKFKAILESWEKATDANETSCDVVKSGRLG